MNTSDMTIITTIQTRLFVLAPPSPKPVMRCHARRGFFARLGPRAALTPACSREPWPEVRVAKTQKTTEPAGFPVGAQATQSRPSRPSLLILHSPQHPWCLLDGVGSVSFTRGTT